MPASIGLYNKYTHRFDDNVTNPLAFQVSGVDAYQGKILYQQYISAIDNGVVPFIPLFNRTDLARVILHHTKVPTMNFTGTYSTNAGLEPPYDTSYAKTSADGWSGGVATNVLTLPGYVAVEAGLGDIINHTSGISLQSGAVSYEFVFGNLAEHCFVFGGGSASIYENGIFLWQGKAQQGDSALIIKDLNNLVHYYLIRKDDQRVDEVLVTRSKLTPTDIKPVWMLYHTGTHLNNLRFTNEMSSVNVDFIGVLEHFEDWANKAQILSTYQATDLKSGRQKFFTYHDKDRISNWNISIDTRENPEWLAFKEFYLYHGIEKEFIFKSLAREEEKWAMFVQPFDDSVNSANHYQMETAMKEGMRTDSLRTVSIS